MTAEKGIALSAFTASALALSMMGLALATHVSQEYFETIHPAVHYARTLADQGGWLRVTFSLDNLFLLSYATFFVLFAVERWSRANRLLVGLTLTFGLAVAVLDMLENHHLLSMMFSAEQGDLFSTAEIRFQEVESSFKFHLSYLALIGAALIYPKDTFLGRLVAFGTGVGYPVLGVACFTAPESLLTWLSLARVAFFVVGLAASGWLYAHRSTSTPLQTA